MTYEETLSYIDTICRQKTVPSLDRIQKLMAKLGNPQDQLKYIHVAGTNGKGSTCTMLASILQKAGYHVGLFTSPHINIFNERIQYDGKMISSDELVEVTEEVKRVITDDVLTVFDLITAISFVYFARKKCDIVIMEVGIGGKLDPTNIIPTPELAILTAMGYDHTALLGNTMEEIASAKAGIIKSSCPVVAYGADAEARAVFARVCQERSCSFTTPDFSKIIIKHHDLDEVVFHYLGHKNLHLSLVGSYQPKNAALVLEAVSVLQSKGWNITDTAIQEGLASVSWPARFEVVSKNPVFIVDGGHNPHGIIGTAESVKTLFPHGNVQIIIGLMADKEWPQMLESLYPLADCFYTTTVGSPRSLSPETLAEAINHSGKGRAIPCPSISDAVRLAKEAAKETGVCCALGSLYLAGEVRALFPNT